MTDDLWLDIFIHPDNITDDDLFELAKAEPHVLDQMAMCREFRVEVKDGYKILFAKIDE